MTQLTQTDGPIESQARERTSERATSASSSSLCAISCVLSLVPSRPVLETGCRALIFYIPRLLHLEAAFRVLWRPTETGRRDGLLGGMAERVGRVFGCGCGCGEGALGVCMCRREAEAGR
jgi:hypothetical protein